MSRSKHQYHPQWHSKVNRKTLKFKNFKLKPYGMCWLSGYGGEYYRRGYGECLFNITKKNKERKYNKVDIHLYDEF